MKGNFPRSPSLNRVHYHIFKLLTKFEITKHSLKLPVLPDLVAELWQELALAAPAQRNVLLRVELTLVRCDRAH